MHQHIDSRGWMIIVESDWTAHDYELLDEVGTGTCRRSDGAAGPLVELVPDGYMLVDYGLPLKVDGGQDRTYLVIDPTRVHVQSFTERTEWIKVEGQLVWRYDDEGRDRLETAD